MVCKRFCYGAESTEQYCNAYTFHLGDHTLRVGKLVDSPPTKPERETCDRKKEPSHTMSRTTSRLIGFGVGGDAA